MKYVRGFFTFWKHFILGDDSTIAVTILWLLLFVWSLSANFLNGWFVMPLIVALLLSVLFYNNTAKTPLFHERSDRFRFCMVTVLPFVVVLGLPLLVFRYSTGISNVRYTILPLVVYVIIAAVLAVITYKPYKRFPAVTVFLFGVVVFSLQQTGLVAWLLK